VGKIGVLLMGAEPFLVAVANAKAYDCSVIWVDSCLEQPQVTTDRTSRSRDLGVMAKRQHKHMKDHHRGSRCRS
jgi:hypothetical protein